MAAENELDAASTSSTKSKHKVSTEQAGEHHEADSGPGDVEANLSKQESAPVYSIFSRRTRIFITVGSSVGALISPLSSTVYLPALTELESDFKVTNAKINLTLTCYTILQAIAPAFYSDFADENGYRPAVIVSYIVYIGANIGLALQNSYGALMGLRAVQATGASATVALTMGVLSAIVTPAERGTFLAYARAGVMLAPSIGPILGGVLAQFLGWRSIFWFLVILSGVYIIPYALFVPETNRKIVGNGSIPPQSWMNKSGLDVLRSVKAESDSSTDDRSEIPRKDAPIAQKPRRRRFPRPWKSLTIALNKDVALGLYFTSILMAAYYAIISTTPTLFSQIYHYNSLQIGLCYIPSGVAATLAAAINGKTQDWNFRRLAKKHNIPFDKRKDMDLRNFPIERCRILPIIPSLIIMCATCVTYGFGLQYGAPVPAALVQQFIMCGFLTSSFNSLSTLMVDWFPTRSATITASANFFRCLFGAASSALIIPIINKMGLGWGFTFVSLLVLIHIPLLYILVRMGPKWREQRRLKEETKRLEKEAREKEKRDEKETGEKEK